jgi:hypothetical protein
VYRSLDHTGDNCAKNSLSKRSPPHSINARCAKAVHEMGASQLSRLSAIIKRGNRGLTSDIVGKSSVAFKLKRPVLMRKCCKFLTCLVGAPRLEPGTRRLSVSGFISNFKCLGVNYDRNRPKQINRLQPSCKSKMLKTILQKNKLRPIQSDCFSGV